MNRAAKVAVLLGGRSPEREVSLNSGEEVFQALLRLGFKACKIDARANLAADLLRERPDVVFIALHGVYGEDGTVQGLLELLDIPYTGSGVLASAIAMDKVVTKRLLVQAGLPTASFEVAYAQDAPVRPLEDLATDMLARMGGQAVFKVPKGGSSIGVYLAHNASEAAQALDDCMKQGREVLVEEYLPGAEVTVPVLGNDRCHVLPLVEIVPKNESYDYESKYAPGGSQHLIPPRLSATMQEEIAGLAMAVYNLLGCAGFARVDLRMDREGKPRILEVNTIPGLTSTSLVPDSARAAGIDFEELILHILELAMEKKRQD